MTDYCAITIVCECVCARLCLFLFEFVFELINVCRLIAIIANTRDHVAVARSHECVVECRRGSGAEMSGDRVKSRSLGDVCACLRFVAMCVRCEIKKNTLQVRRNIYKLDCRTGNPPVLNNIVFTTKWSCSAAWRAFLIILRHRLHTHTHTYDGNDPPHAKTYRSAPSS